VNIGLVQESLKLLIDENPQFRSVIIEENECHFG
jgi:hypothetical protein